MVNVPVSAIYTIKNNLNGKIYVGSAVHYVQRWNNHKSDLRLQKHCNRMLQNAWNKYGEDVFIFEVVEYILDPLQLLGREQYWMDKLDVYKNGYNMTPTAGSPFGRAQTDETKEKLRASMLTPKNRALISALHSGKVVSAETRAKQSAAKMGKRKSPEEREKMRASHALFWESEEGKLCKAKLSAKAKAQWVKRREI